MDRRRGDVSGKEGAVAGRSRRRGNCGLGIICESKIIKNKLNSNKNKTRQKVKIHHPRSKYKKVHRHMQAFHNLSTPQPQKALLGKYDPHNPREVATGR